jgi:hypothetical protein
MLFQIHLNGMKFLGLMHFLPGWVPTGDCTKGRTERDRSFISGRGAICYVQMELLEEAEGDSSSLISNFRIRTTHFTVGCCYKFKYNRTMFHSVANLSNTIITNAHTQTHKHFNNTLILFLYNKKSDILRRSDGYFFSEGMCETFLPAGSAPFSFPIQLIKQRQKLLLLVP